MPKPKDYFWQSVLLIYAVALCLIALYYLPEEVLGHRLKRLDLLSQLRIEREDEYQSLLAQIKTKPQRKQRPALGPLQADGSATSSGASSSGQDSTSATTLSTAQGDSLRHTPPSEQAQVVDVLTPIQDFSSNQKALAHFYRALDRASAGQLGRPARIAFLGDSFIEGDVFTAPLRNLLQGRWGGAGVGWMPMSSQVAGFRNSIQQHSKGWQERTVLDSKGVAQLLTGRNFTPTSDNWVQYTLPKGQRAFSQATLYYSSQSERTATLHLDTVSYTYTLPNTSGALHAFAFEPQMARQLKMKLGGDGAFISYGMALETGDGVVVDSYSMRGSSGLILGNISEAISQSYASARPYDLIVLEYGLNVASNTQTNYSSWSKQMSKVIAKLRSYYPQASLLLIGVSDRVERTESGMRTMPGVLAMHHTQEELAKAEGIAFWSLLRAMHQLGGIEAMTRNKLAAKDYTHVSHSGGSKLAQMLYEALLAEKEYYHE